jgi:hypothetical protein
MELQKWWGGEYLGISAAPFPDRLQNESAYPVWTDILKWISLTWPDNTQIRNPGILPTRRSLGGRRWKYTIPCNGIYLNIPSPGSSPGATVLPGASPPPLKPRSNKLPLVVTLWVGLKILFTLPYPLKQSVSSVQGVSQNWQKEVAIFGYRLERKVLKSLRILLYILATCWNLLSK